MKTDAEPAELTAHQRGSRLSAQERQDQHPRPWNSGFSTPSLQGQTSPHSTPKHAAHPLSGPGVSMPLAKGTLGKQLCAPGPHLFPGLDERGHVSSRFSHEATDPHDSLNPTAAAKPSPALPTWISRAAGHQRAVSLLQIKGPNLNPI